MFHACLDGDLEAVKTEYEKMLNTEDGKQVPFLQPLATLTA
jgi:hypothetical protein